MQPIRLKSPKKLLETTTKPVANKPSRKRGPPRVLAGPHGCPRAFHPGGFPPCKISFFRVFRRVFAGKKNRGGCSKLDPQVRSLKANFQNRTFRTWISTAAFQRPEVGYRLPTSGAWILTSKFRLLRVGSRKLGIQRQTADLRKLDFKLPTSDSQKLGIGS